MRKTAMPCSQRGSFFWAPRDAGKTLMNSEHSWDWIAATCCPASKGPSMQCPWIIILHGNSGWGRWMGRKWLSKCDLMIERAQCTYDWASISNDRPIHSFHPRLWHALLEPGTGLGTRESCPGLLEGASRSYISDCILSKQLYFHLPLCWKYNPI